MLAYILAISAIVITIAGNAWAINQRRMLNQWSRSGFAGPMPRWWQVRWRPSAPPLIEPQQRDQ